MVTDCRESVNKKAIDGMTMAFVFAVTVPLLCFLSVFECFAPIELLCMFMHKIWCIVPFSALFLSHIDLQG